MGKKYAEETEICFRFRLYIAGDTRDSAAAAANFRKFIAEHVGADNCDLEIVDIVQSPERALEDDILVTPTLLRLGPGKPLRIVGALDLSEPLVNTLLSR